MRSGLMRLADLARSNPTEEHWYAVFFDAHDRIYHVEQAPTEEAARNVTRAIFGRRRRGSSVEIVRATSKLDATFHARARRFAAR